MTIAPLRPSVFTGVETRVSVDEVTVTTVFQNVTANVVWSSDPSGLPDLPYEQFVPEA